jgi:hypothetical protein
MLFISNSTVSQPRTQAQITKNRHTTVFLYRSVAKLSERAKAPQSQALKIYFTGPSDKMSDDREFGSDICMMMSDDFSSV